MNYDYSYELDNIEMEQTFKPMNFNNYGPYIELAQTGHIKINSIDIKYDNWNDHFESIYNILLDSIETEFTQNMFITILFNNGIDVDLSITDYLFNLIMWKCVIRVGDILMPHHIFFDKAITKRTIKSYIDEFIIENHRTNFPIIELNNIIDDAIFYFNRTDKFSMYLANTINLEDTVFLMTKDQEFYNALHADLSKVPIEKVKSKGMEYTEQIIEKMKNAKSILGYDHCLADCWRAKEGINPKQFREVAVNIGSKPDGQGGVYPVNINNSFMNGGVPDPLSYMIESSAGRTAQILAKLNVGDSGHFARILSLNNFDTILNQDPGYSCNTKNFVELVIKDDKILEKVNNRYYRLHPKGQEFLLRYKYDKHLIGQKIYLRSPMTCASLARGEGICYKCYGNLAYVNKDINIGMIASEILSSRLTQILLSAKHLLETSIRELVWPEKFSDVFEIDTNMIRLIEDVNFKGWKIIIDRNDIQLENENDYKDDRDDDFEMANDIYNEYITEFLIVDPVGNEYKMHTENYDNLYISNEFNNIIRKKIKNVDGKAGILLQDIKDNVLFYMIIQNNELSKTLDRLNYILNKKSVTKTFNKDELLQNLIETVIEGGLQVSSTHLEVILANQIRSAEDILEKPQWQYPNEPYEVLTLNEALSNNPSVTVSLSYQYQARALYNPLTFRKNKPSFMDLFFMEQPQEYINPNRVQIEDEDKLRKDKKFVTPVIFSKDLGYTHSFDDEPEEEETLPTE